MRWPALGFIVVAGLLVFGICMHYALQDWAALNREYARFERLASSAAELRSIVIANAHQHAFRTNVFADGVWALPGAIIAAIGVHGMCVMPRSDRRRDSEERGE